MHLNELTSNITIKCQQGTRLPYDKQDNWQRKAQGYTCTLTNKKTKHKMTFDFWQGTGINQEPTVDGTLTCLLSDASSADNHTFEEFCSKFDYDTDSRSAEHTYKSCLAITKKLKTFLGPQYNTFLLAELD